MYELHDDAAADKMAVVLTDRQIREEQELTASAQTIDEADEPDEETHPNPMHAGPNNFFYRMMLPSMNIKWKKGQRSPEIDSLPTHCVCEKPYSPSVDVMRHCLSCPTQPKWFHVACLDKWDDADEIPEYPLPDGADPPAELLELAKLPIVRGSWWGLGGNINLVAKARKLVAKGSYDNWEKKMVPAGLQEWRDWNALMQNRKPADEASTELVMAKGYKCPECSARI